MENVKVIVLRAAGINCDLETQNAFELAGAQAERVHINRLIEEKNALDGFQILVIPGGFSYGDDVAAGKILANQIKHHLYEQVRKFIDKGSLVLGICNGFQVLVKVGILPFADAAGQPVTVTYNDSNKFEDRWVYLEPASDRCIFIEKGRRIYLPIAHGEGKVVTKDQPTLDKLQSENYIAFKYVDENGKEGGFPVNPNGSVHSIAGFTDSTGRVLGLMPHPERHIRHTQHPRWTRLLARSRQGRTRLETQDPRPQTQEADGMTIFTNAVKYVRENL
ncbi:MAG: phosphoribosylformylglycinamidine synthase I [Sedimentisphaerales bacterium]